MSRLLAKSFSENPKSAIQNRKWAAIFAITFTFALGGAVAWAQQPAKVPRIGYLSAVSASTISARTEAFRQGLPSASLGTWRGKRCH
jgi:hypothetical protein